jgi:hypothetical protein
MIRNIFSASIFYSYFNTAKVMRLKIECLSSQLSLRFINLLLYMNQMQKEMSVFSKKTGKFIKISDRFQVILTLIYFYVLF